MRSPECPMKAKQIREPYHHGDEQTGTALLVETETRYH